MEHFITDKIETSRFEHTGYAKSIRTIEGWGVRYWSFWKLRLKWKRERNISNDMLATVQQQEMRNTTRMNLKQGIQREYATVGMVRLVLAARGCPR